MLLTGTLEELSNQRRSKKIGDGTETKETELDVLQRHHNKGAKGWESGGRGIVPGMLIKLLVKDKLPHSNSWRERTEIRVLQYTVQETTVCAATTPTVSSTVFHPSENFMHTWLQWIHRHAPLVLKDFLPSISTLSLMNVSVTYYYYYSIHVVFYCSLRLAPKCIASTLLVLCLFL